MKKLIYLSLLALSASLPGCLTTTPSSGSIGVSPDLVTVAAGTKQAFSAILTGSVANSSVKWSIFGTGCAAGSCGTIDQTGMYTAPTTVPANPAVQIVATATSDRSKSGFANVTIAPAVGISFTSQPATLSVAAGQQLFPFQVSVTNTSNTNVNWSVTGAGCNGAACGVITPASPVPQTTPVTYTAPTTLPNPPIVTITAASAADPTKTATLNVSLTLSVQVTPSNPPVALLAQQQFTANVVGQGANTLTVSWALTQAGVACAPGCGSINANGLYTAPAAPINPSTVTVTANVTAGPFFGTAFTTLTVGGTASTPLFGTYALQYRDYPGGALSPRVEAGSLVFAANGQIHGVEDDNDGATPVNHVNAQRAVTGQATFDTNSTTSGTITLSTGLVTSLRFTLVPEPVLTTAQTVHLSGLSGTTAGAGRLDQQDTTKFSAATLTGGYALMMRGGNNSSLTIGTFASAVGRFNLSGGNISSGEIGRGFDDANFGDCGANQTIAANPTPLNYPVFGGNYGNVNVTTGNTSFMLTGVHMGGQNGGATVSNLTLSFSAYVVSATKVIFIETDTGGATGGYAFLGSAEQQTLSHTFVDNDLNGTYSTLLQSNNGPGAGNVIHTPLISAGTGTFGEVEYTGNLDGGLQYGLNSFGYYSMIQPNGLALVAFCEGINMVRVPMYFVSSQKAFAWAEDAADLTVNPAVPLVADLVGEMDIQAGGPFGGQGETGIVTTPFAVGFEGVTGNFNNTHSPTGGIAETGTVVFTTSGTKCVFIVVPVPASTPCTVGTNGVLEQFGTATFTLDLADASGTQTTVPLNATFTFNDDADGESDDDEGHGTLTFSTTPFPVPDHFQMISSKKILLLYCGTANAVPPVCNSRTANVAGVIEQH
jgi:hypothetical protein